MSALVWITGASAGLGAALVAAMPYDDAHVVDISRSGGTPGTEHLPADLADPASWPAVEEHLVERLRGFDGARAVFVHNAAVIEPIGSAGVVDSAAYTRNVLLNSAAPQVLGHAFLRALRGAARVGHATLALVTSGAATTAYAGWSAYGAGKAACDHWVRCVGAEQDGERPVSVVAIAPGVVDTAMQQAIRAADPQDFPTVGRFHELHATGALVRPDEAATRFWDVVASVPSPGTVTDLRSRG